MRLLPGPYVAADRTSMAAVVQARGLGDGAFEVRLSAAVWDPLAIRIRFVQLGRFHSIWNSPSEPDQLHLSHCRHTNSGLSVCVTRVARGFACPTRMGFAPLRPISEPRGAVVLLLPPLRISSRSSGHRSSLPRLTATTPILRSLRLPLDGPLRTASPWLRHLSQPNTPIWPILLPTTELTMLGLKATMSVSMVE